MIQRTEIKELTERLKEPRKFIQVIVGPRDEWLAEKWQSARLMVQSRQLSATARVSQSGIGVAEIRPHQCRTAYLQLQIQTAASFRCRK